jgi:tetratricopeptide (TPR) repeat protein
MQEIELILEKSEEYYYNGDLRKAISLFEKNESIVNAEGFDEYLKIQFYVSYIATLVVTILMENRSFEEIEKKILDCKEMIKDKNSLEFARINLQHAIAWDYKPVDNPEEKEENLDKAIILIDEVIVLLEKLDVTKYHSQAYFYRGLFFERRRQLESAEKWYILSHQLAKEKNFPIEDSFAIRHLGFINLRRDKLDKAKELLEESLKLREDAGFKIGIPHSILSMGDIHILMKDFHKAMEYYKSGYDYAVKIGSKLAQTIGLTSIGRTYTRLERYEEAAQYLEDAIKLADQIGAVDLLNVAKKTLDTKSVD